jgi:hypothetical protein
MFRFSKERILNVSILVVGYLLISTYQVLSDPSLGLGGEISFQYTTPIPQQTNFTVTRESFPSTNSAVILNLTPYTKNIGYYLPRLDYDTVVFNLTLEPMSSESEATFSIYIPRHSESIRTTQIISNVTTLTLQSDYLAARNSSDYWLTEVYMSVSPLEEFLCHSLIVWANSSAPLCPVSLDIKTTDGRSLFENAMMDEMMSTSPQLEISRNNLSSSTRRFWPYSVNHTFYLRPGSLNGSCYWGGFSYNRITFNFTYTENERVFVVFHLKAVEVELSFDTSYPVHHLFWDEGTYDYVYNLYLTPKSNPIFLYIPPDYLHVAFSIVDPLNVELNYREPQTIASVSSNLQVNGSYNLKIDVEFGSALEVVYARDTTIGVFSITLFFLVFLRLGVLINSKQKVPKNWLKFDFRLIPSLIFVFLAFIPWFSSTQIHTTYSYDTVVTVYSIFFGPIPVIGVWTEGSTLLLTIPSYAIAWSFWSILLYWLPLLWSIVWFRTPHNRDDDILMGLLLFIPAGFLYLVQFFHSDMLLNIRYDIFSGLYDFIGRIAQGTTNNILMPFINPIFSFVIPIAWFILVGVLSIRGYYAFGEHINTRERDSQASGKLAESKSKQIEETSKKPYSLEIIFGFILILTALFPSVIGFRYWYSSSVPESAFFVFPIQALGYLLDMGINSYRYIKLSALLVGIPYACFTALDLIWFWDRLDRKRSLVWVLFGSIISVISMIPGITILNWMGEHSPFLVSYTWIPFPLATFVILAFSFIVWERDLYKKVGEDNKTQILNV